jgi:hypothetical protein
MRKPPKVKKEFSCVDKEIVLKDLYQVELKTLATYYRLRTSGTKNVLIERIEMHLSNLKCSILIQKNVRAYFARKLVKMLLLMSKTKKMNLCVNETDFYTLEPLNDIPYYLFFYYTDEQEFTYGFNIESLMHLYIKTGKVVNPYNRNKIPIEIMFDIFTTYGLLRIFFKNSIDRDIKLHLPDDFTFKIMNVNSVYTTANDLNMYVEEEIETNDIILNNTTSNDNYFDFRSDQNIMQLLPIQQRTNSNLVIMKERLQNIRNSIDIVRQNPLDRRIISIFMEIDQLGHYTNSSWLQSLSIIEMKRFILSLREIWIYRANIIDRIKYRIFPFGDPFNSIIEILNQDIRHEVLTSCVSIIENFVLSAPDVDDRKLSTLFVLSALTRVSLSARRQLSWLYESIDWT